VAAQPRDVVAFILRNTRRVAVSIVGGAVLLAGLAMLVLPGPGFLVVVLGFAILGTEYAWAAAALARTKKATDRAGQAATRAARSLRPRGRRRPPPT